MSTLLTAIVLSGRASLTRLPVSQVGTGRRKPGKLSAVERSGNRQGFSLSLWFRNGQVGGKGGSGEDGGTRGRWGRVGGWGQVRVVGERE